MSTETAGARLVRLTQAGIGDTLHDGNGAGVAVVNAFTTVNPETGTTVRAVDYWLRGGTGQFRLYADDADDAARWRVEKCGGVVMCRSRWPPSGSTPLS